MTMPGGSNDRQVDVTLNANVDPFVRSMTAANQATLKLGDSLKKIDDYMVRLTKRAGIGAMAVGGAGLVSTFGDVKQAAALQQSFSALAAQATQTGVSVGTVSTQVLKLSTQIPVATQSLAAMATQISALGVTGTNNIMRLTKQAEQLAAATNTAPGALFTSLIQMNQSLGGSLQNLERYGSSLTALQQNMGVSATETMTMASSIQAVGQKAGISEQNLLGLSAAFVKVGADGASGAQAFNQVMNAMTDSVARNSTSMLQFTNVMGITVDQFKSLVTNDPTQAFVKFIDAISSQGAKASITLQSLGLDSVRTQRVFAALTSGQANLGAALAQSNQAFQQNTATTNAAAAAWDTLDSKLQMLKNSAGQIKDQLGGPLLSVFAPITEGLTAITKGFSEFIHFTSEGAPWPIGDTLTALVTKTPALLLLGGAFITLTAAVSKFAGAWRLVTGMVGVNAFRGFMDARRGNGPRDVQENLSGIGGRVGSLLYRSSYGLGRGSSDIGVNARQGIGGLIAGYPFMRARQQFGQSLDTLLHPLSPEKRDSGRSFAGARLQTDPLSMYGMYQAAQRRGQDARAGLVLRLRNPNASAFQNNLADHLEAGFGSFDDSAEGLRRRRFTYVEQARQEAISRQRRINSTLGRNDLVDLVGATEASQYYQKNGTLDGYQATDFSRVGISRLRKMGKRQSLYVGEQAATRAGTAFDQSMSEEETAKLANPFQKLAAKVKEITGELTTTTASATKSVFASIESLFSQAMAKIMQMAQAAKAQIAGVAATAANPAAADATVRLGSGYPPPIVPRVDPATTREAARIQAEETIKASKAALPSVADIAAESVVGFPSGTRLGGVGPRRGVFSRNTVAGSVEEGIPEGMVRGGTAGVAARFRTIGQAIAGPDSFLRDKALPAVGEVAKGVGGMLASFGGAVKNVMGMFLSPQLLIGATLLGPTIWNLAQKLFSTQSFVAGKTDFFGASTQQSLGRQVLSPTQIAQQRQTAISPDHTDLFGATAISNSKSGTFSDNHSSLLSSLDAIRNSNLSPQDKATYERAIFQQEAIGDVNQNGGTPLDASQKQDLATLALSFTNQNTGQARQLLGGSDLSSIDTTGTGGGTFYKDLSTALAKGGITGSSRTQLLKALGGQSETSYETQGGSLAGAIYAAANTQQLTGGNKFDPYKAEIPTPNGPVMGRPGDARGFGNTQTADVLKSFVDNYNANHDKNKLNIAPTDSVQAFYDQLQKKAATGDETAQNVLRSFKQLGLTFDSSGALTKASLDKLATAASGAADALTGQGGSTQVSHAANLPITQAFDQVTHGNDGSLLAMLTTPDSKNYTKDITQMLQQLSGASNQGVFDPKNAQALRSEAEAIGALKQEVAQGGPQWQQLDQLQQGVFSQLAQVPLMSGQGFTGQLAAQVSTMTDYVNGAFTSNTAGDYNTQLDTTKQMAGQAVTQLQQYYMQVKDAHIQMERGQEDHTIQMVRSQRDFNRQMSEAQYQFGIQQREAAYQYNLNNTEQLYQFNEQIRQMKYSLANAMGPAGAQMQAQYTMGASSALTGFNAQTQALQRSNTAVNSLSKMGLSSDVIRVFKLDDPTNFAQAERYLNDFVSNPQLIQSFNDMVAKNLNISQAIATDPNNAQFADLQRQFDHTAKVAADSFTHSGEVATEAFTHSMTQAKQSYDIQMADFQADYDRQTARSLQDLSRLGEETQMTWQQLVDWAQNSGIPAVENLGNGLAGAMNVIQRASDGVMNSLQQLPQMFSTTLSQISSSLQSFINANPAVGRAFEQANGIATPSISGLSGVQSIVNAVASQEGWGSGNEWAALSQIIQHESGWNPNAQNPGSSAYGLFQFLNSTWAGTGYGKSSDPQTQAAAGMKYIANRYGDPINAWNFWQRNHWYKAGGVFDKPQVIGIGEAGPEAVLPLDSRGAAFMAQTLRASVQMMGPNLLTEVRRGRTAPFSERMASNMSYHHTDASTHYHGGITVQAQDPNEMARKLAAKQRLSRLGRPASAR